MGSANLEAGATSPRSDSIAIPTSGHSPVQLVCCTIYLPIFSSSSLSPSKSQSRESNAINSYMYLWTVSPSHRRWKANGGGAKKDKVWTPFFPVRQSYRVHVLWYQQHWFPERTISLSLFQYHENKTQLSFIFIDFFDHVIRPDPTSANVITAPTIYGPL